MSWVRAESVVWGSESEERRESEAADQGPQEVGRVLGVGRRVLRMAESGGLAWASCGGDWGNLGEKGARCGAHTPKFNMCNVHLL